MQKKNLTFNKCVTSDQNLCLKEQCHEGFAVLDEFCAKIITLRL